MGGEIVDALEALPMDLAYLSFATVEAPAIAARRR